MGPKFVDRRRVQVPYEPLSIHFGATRRCNLKCLTCNTRSLLTKNVEDMTYGTFCKVINQLPHYTMRRVTCEGPGEPLLNPDLINMFAYAKQKGFITHTFTNATLLNEVDTIPLLKALDEITISIDGATKETYEKIRIGGKFEDVIRNVKQLAATKRKIRAPTYLQINFTCNRLNYLEIPKMVLLASQLGVDCLELSLMREFISWRPSKEYQHIIADELTCSFADIKKSIPTTPRIELKIDYPGSLFPGCTWPFRACYVTDNGFVTPCCVIPDSERITFGNIVQEPLKKIWNNESYQEFRRQFILGKPPEVCLDCQTVIT
ncbi:radical SAM protein [Candidatus Bathyarchaeota archaeon A05DMB-2]|nr:radical SAM protein [Candidatus Bathyarchaeota archaeon A05DMB-2]